LERPQVEWHSHSEGERSATLPPTPTPTTRTPPPEISCVFLHSPSLNLNPSFESEGEAFSLPGLTHSLPEFSDPDSTREFSLHAYSFVRESEATYRSSPAYGDVNPRARKKAHLEVNISPSSRNSPAEPSTTLLFVYNVYKQLDFSRTKLTYIQSTGAPAGEAGPFHCLHGGTSAEIKSRDPSSFQKFPSHQFFAKLYRPFAVRAISEITHRLADKLSASTQCPVAKLLSLPDQSGAQHHGRISQRPIWTAFSISKSCSPAYLSARSGPSRSLHPHIVG
jgi:hypothetical protein